MTNDEYTWTDNPTVSGVSVCNTDVLNECLMHLKYDHKGNGSGLNLFDVIEKDHILSTEESKGFAPLGTYVYKEPASSNRYGYPDFYAKCLEEKADGLEVEIQLEENTITVYKNMNGHIFYNIADKDVVDLYYIHTGACWMYGIDEENERIFLPRNDWFTMSGKSDEVGEFVEAGLPNITGAFDRPNRNGAGAATGAFSNGASVGGYARDGAVDSSLVNFDASNSNSIYGKSDTVQPPAVKKILYMVVGNTEVTSSITNVTEITTSENDTIPLGCSRYSGEILSPSAGWLKSSGQWNSGNLYTSFYNMAVSKIGQTFASGAIVENTSEYTDYDLVVNQTDMTFRLPLLDGSESLPSDRYINLELLASGSTYTAPANGFVYIYRTGLSSGNTTYIGSGGIGSKSSAATGSLLTQNFLPVRKGQSFTVTYSGSTTSFTFRFSYAQGNGSLYFKVANAVQNLELLNVGEVTEALADKVDYSDTEWATNACMPDYSAGIEIVASNTEQYYTCPSDGFVIFSGGAFNGQYSYLKVNDVVINNASTTGNSYITNVFACALVSKNDVCKFRDYYNNAIFGHFFKFFPLKGAN